MTIPEKELLHLAAIGAAYEANFCKEHGLEHKEEYFSAALDALTHARSVKNVVRKGGGRA